MLGKKISAICIIKNTNDPMIKITSLLIFGLLFSMNIFSQSLNASAASIAIISHSPNPENSETHRFLFDRSIKGKLTSIDENILDDNDMLFNYDLTDKVVVVNSQKAVVKVPVSNIKSVEFKEKENSLVFEPNPAILKGELLQVLVKNDVKYTLYKTVAANSTDQIQYFILFPNKEYLPVTLNKKIIFQTLSSNSRAEYYNNEHRKDKADETYLINFINYLNYF